MKLGVRRSILVFFLMALLSVAAALIFVQTPTFANLVKQTLVRFIPGDPGIDGDFTDFSVNLLPPGVAVNHPVVTVRKKNILGLPEGTAVSARKIILSFQPFQMLSGRISIDRVIIDDGKVASTIADAASTNGGRNPRDLLPRIQWTDLLKVRAEEIEFRNTEIALTVLKPAAHIDLVAERIRLARETRGSRLSFLFSSAEQVRTVYAMDLALSRLSVGWGDPMRQIEGFRSVTLNGEIAPERIEFSGFSFERNGLVASGSGRIEGDLLAATTDRLPLAADLKLSGDLSRWGDILMLLGVSPADGAVASPPAGIPGLRRTHLPALPAEGKGPEIAGSFDSQVRLDGNLLDWQRSASARVRLEASSLKFGPWAIAHLEAEGAWRAKSGEMGEVEIKSARATSPQKPRFGGRAPGDGGVVELGAFRYRPGSKDPFRIPVRISEAHLHWLAAPLLQELWPLDLRANGTLDVEVLPRSSLNWEVRSKVDLSVPKLVLDNQRRGFDRPLSKVLEIDSVSLRGPVTVDRHGLNVNALDLKLPHSRGTIDGNVQFGDRKADPVVFDLRLMSQMDLADIGHIGKPEIRGKGTLDLRVRGPSSRVMVDFLPSIENTEYLGLEFGKLEGRITMDEAPSIIRFDRVAATKGGLSYTLDGTVNYGTPDSIDLTADVAGGDMQEFLSVFHRLTDDIWWFPHSLQGAVSGKVRVFGGLDLDLLSVTGDLGGSDWRLLGERFRRVTLKGGYDRGRYYFDTFRALKKNGRISASISYVQPVNPSGAGNVEWDLASDGLTLGDLTWIAGLDVPLRGDLSIRSHGSGKMGFVDSESILDLAQASIRGQSVPQSRLQISTAKGRMEANGRLFGDQGRLRWIWDSRTSSDSLLELQAKDLDLSGILLVLNPSLVQDRALKGLVTGAADFRVSDGDVERVDGDLRVEKFLASKSGAQLQLVSPVAIHWKSGTSSPTLVRLESAGAARPFEIELETRSGRIDGSFEGAANLALLEFVNPVVERAKGVAAITGRLGGTLLQPTMTAHAALDSAGPIQIRGLDTPFDRISGELDYSDLKIRIPRLDADLGGGSIRGAGEIELFVDRVPKLSLSAQLSGARLKIWPFQFVKLNGRADVTGDRLPYLVSGKFNVDSAFSRESFSASRTGHSSSSGAKSSRFAPPSWSGGVLDEPLFALSLDVSADRGILFQNELIDAEMKGAIHIGNTLDDPQITGKAQIVQGRAIFKDRVFQILSTEVDFDRPATFDPKFNMLASIELQSARVQLGISGRPSSYRVDLTSNPVMPESEIISLLALGVTRDELGRFRSTDRSNIDRTEAASLVLHSTDFNRDLEKKTGLQLQIDEAVDATQGTSIFRPSNGTESASAPKIVVKRRIGERVDVSVGSTVGVGTSSQKAVNAEYKVSPGVSVIGVWDTTEGTGSDAQSRDSFGLDLKVQKRFK